MSRFWVYVGDKVQGPLDIPSLRKVEGFNLLSQVCQEGEQTWRMADEVIEIKAYFISPPRANSFAIDSGNAAPKLDLTPTPMIEELTLPEPNLAWQKAGGEPKIGDLEILLPGDPKKKEAVGPANGLRAVCDVCGYKNPRDVAVCMKCGEGLKGGAAQTRGPRGAAPARETPLDLKSKDVPPGLPVPPSPIPKPDLVPPAPSPDPNANTMVEISMSKLLAGCAVAGLVIGGSFFGYRWFHKRQARKHSPKAAVAAVAAKPAAGAVRKVSKRPGQKPVRPVADDVVTTLPGVAKKATAHEHAAAEPKTNSASYRVVEEASPLKKRFSSPVNSPYAVKRRANQGLWTSQEDQSIQQVQRNRIYGGQRTIERNVEILMQILRDREYNTAFESGRRISLYNDVDWSAVLKDGPVYEVRLSFSGGREADGSPKKPLRFAFSSDLERGTVEPGGQDQVRSNTLHAFFDESRIAPEDRRAIAKDTEELVMASQPGASPLALDTVVRQFAKVYTTAALTRVADAYDLALVKKKLAHDTRLGSDEPVTAVPVVKGESTKPVPSTEGWEKAGMKVAPAPAVESQASNRTGDSNVKMITSPFKGGAAPEFRMEKGNGRERTFMVRAASRASINRIWETITGYDRLKQFMPDMLASEREGQDGAATIVHLVCLTRYMVFMFKMNLHLRVVEHPREHTLEFERIAGEFESFRGSVELATDPATHDTLIAFHATLVPAKGGTKWSLETMARRLLIPQIQAIRAKAESN